MPTPYETPADPSEKPLGERFSSNLLNVEAAPLDRPGMIYLGEMLPGIGWTWRQVEREALGIDAGLLPHLRFITAHEALRIRAALREEGRVLG